MADLGELREWWRADALCGGERVAQLWILGFQLDETAKKPVILSVAHQRVVEDVVAIVVQGQLLA
jgi:hypothetical protein